ncbi:MAG TPA: MFS transporter [Cyclobacteriaceae bacterium]|nr:MFS transporter [Cyclobacteriaceae bacterium]
MTESYSKVRQAVLLIFLVCGLGLSSWAPMVPFTKERLGLNEAGLGVLLLGLGAGAIIMMPITGWLIQRFGSRRVMLLGGVSLSLILPVLLLLNNPIAMGVALFLFGASIGAIDIAMNEQAIRVQRLYGRHIMSSFHGFFSVGGLFGALGLGALIKVGLSPLTAAVSISCLLLAIVLTQYKHLLPFEAKDKQTGSRQFRWPKSSVLYLGMMCFIVFLAEGAMLDWSAVFLQFNRNFDIAWSGTGYAAFSVAMAVMRLTGDRLMNKFSPQQMVIYGSLVAAAGLLLAVGLPWRGAAIGGFILVGLGCANIVPVFFSAAGNMPHTPVHIALPTITTIGYAGQLAGPALLGIIAHALSLPFALAFVAGLLFIVAVSYRFFRFG